MIEPRLDAVAVEFDLVQPARIARRRGPQCRERGRKEVRQRVAGGLRLRRLALLGGLALLRRHRRAPRRACAAAPRGGGDIPAGGLGRFFGRFLRHLFGTAVVARLPDPLAAATLRNLLHGAAAHHRQRLFLEHIRIARGSARFGIWLMQPAWGLPSVLSRPYPNQMPSTFELLAIEYERQMAFLIS